MESKKSAKLDLNKKSPLFFSIGLFLSLGLTLAVFEARTYDRTIDLGSDRAENTMDELLDIPITEQLPPPPPPVQQPQVVEVPEDEILKDEIQVNLDVESTPETKVVSIEIKTEEEEEEDANLVFNIVEEQASPVGGTNSFYQYLAQKIKYPEQAKRMGVEGRVYCEFIVNKDGTLQEVKVMRGIGAGCDEEAVRVLESSPRWNPAKQRGKPVRSRYHMAIIFKMS